MSASEDALVASSAALATMNMDALPFLPTTRGLAHVTRGKRYMLSDAGLSVVATPSMRIVMGSFHETVCCPVRSQ